jgi:hypothetical protein
VSFPANTTQVECSRLDLRHSIDILYPRQPNHLHVRPLPRRLCLRALASLHRLPHHHLASLLCRHVREPRSTQTHQYWPVLHLAIMPSRTGKGYASNDFVWKEWQNQAGWSSDGLVFCLGMLNGAFAVGTPLVLPTSTSCPSPIPSYDEDANPDVIGTAYPTSQKNSPTPAPTSPKPSSPNTPWAS